MAQSEVEICNSALIKIGAERISAMDQKTETARLCKEQYYKVRDKVLRGHPWNFAIDRKSLAVVSDVTPASEFTYAYQIPEDCLRILEVNCRMSWQKEGQYLVTDSNSVVIKYIKKITDVSKYDASFAEALAANLAADICYSLVQNASLKDVLMKEADMALRQARSFDAQEGTPQQVVADDWLTVRY